MSNQHINKNYTKSRILKISQLQKDGDRYLGQLIDNTLLCKVLSMTLNINNS